MQKEGGSNVLSSQLEDLLIRRRETIKDSSAAFKIMISSSQKPPAPLFTSSIFSSGLTPAKFLDVDPLEIARQITIIEAVLYKKILPVDLLNKAWSNPKINNGNNISALKDLSNQISRWVTKFVLSENSARQRAKIMTHFIQVADVSPRNFFSVCFICHVTYLYY